MFGNATYVVSKVDARLNPRVEVVGARDGFTYIRFEDGTATKVPPSWVEVDVDDDEVELADETTPQYEWTCFGTIVCDPLVDTHGRECDRLNDEAREEFYAEVVAEDVGALVEWHVAHAIESLTRAPMGAGPCGRIHARQIGASV